MRTCTQGTTINTHAWKSSQLKHWNLPHTRLLTYSMHTCSMQGKGVMETFILEPDTQSEAFSRDLALVSRNLKREPPSALPKFSDLIER
jgi:hypothetical protein